jgi:hypothetical protein
MARAMHFELQTKDPKNIPPPRRLMVLPAHDAKAKHQGHMANITAVNHPQSVRGIYRWLKRNYASVQ